MAHIGGPKGRTTSEEERIKESLRSDSLDVRLGAFRALDKLKEVGDPDLVTLLVMALMDSDPNDARIRLFAKDKLERLCPTWPATQNTMQLVPKFIDVIRHGGANPVGPFGAVYALGKIRDTRGVGPLIDLLKVAPITHLRLRAIRFPLARLKLMPSST